MKLLSLAVILGMVISLVACGSPAVTSTSTVTTTATSTVTSTFTTTAVSTLTMPTTITITSTVTSTGSTTTSTSSATTTTTTGTTGTSTPATGTFAQLAVNGEPLFNNNCGRCHGTFSGEYGHSVLAEYGDAGRLLAKIISMPVTLTQQQGWEILSFLLLENGFVAGEAVFNAGALSQIPLPE